MLPGAACPCFYMTGQTHSTNNLSCYTKKQMYKQLCCSFPRDITELKKYTILHKISLK